MIIKFNEIKKIVQISLIINHFSYSSDNIFDYEFLSLIENEIKNIQDGMKIKIFGSINKRIMNTYENFPPNVKVNK